MKGRFSLGYRVLSIIIILGLIFTFDSIAYAKATITDSGEIKHIIDYDYDKDEPIFETISWNYWSDGLLQLTGNGTIVDNDKYDYGSANYYA